MTLSSFLETARGYWHPAARSADLASGEILGVRVCAVPVVLWRGADGTISAVVDRCPHRGTRLSAGHVTASGTLACPYHAWEFDSFGTCVSIPQAPTLPIPAKTTVDAVRVAERYGLVWVCVADDEPASELPECPEASLPGWRTYVGEPVTWACGVTRQIENFCDVGHFSVLHTDTFGNPDVLEVQRHEVTHQRSKDGDRIEAVFFYPGIDRTVDPPRPIEMPVRYRMELPFAVSLSTSDPPHPSVLFCATCPVDDETCRVFWFQVQPETDAPPDELLQRYETMIFEADRSVIETQDPPLAPLDPSMEVHLPFDKLAVAYRRALVAMGFPIT